MNTATRRWLDGTRWLGIWLTLCLSALPLGAATAGDGKGAQTRTSSGFDDVVRTADSTEMRDASLVHPWDNSDFSDTSLTGGPGLNRRRPKTTLPPVKSLDPPPLNRAYFADVRPETLSLGGNYPNPFNAQTRIVFALRASADVQIRIYNLLGQKLATVALGGSAAGEHEWTWDGTDGHHRPVPSGIYFYEIATNGQSAVGKMVLLK